MRFTRGRVAAVTAVAALAGLAVPASAPGSPGPSWPQPRYDAAQTEPISYHQPSPRSGGPQPSR